MEEEEEERLSVASELLYTINGDGVTEPEDVPLIDQDAHFSTAPSSNRNTKWDLNYHEAAIFLQEGENNDKFTTHPRNQKALPAYLITHNTYFYLLNLVASLVLLGLAVIERPAVFSVHVGIHGSLELLCLLIIVLELAMRYKWLGFKTFIQHRRTVVKTICLVIMLVEAIVVLSRQASHFRITRAIRPLFLLDSYYLRNVRRFTRQILQSLPAIVDMLILLLFFMLLFSILGFYLFSNIPTELGPEYQYAYFQSLPDSFISMFVLLTTANFPDVMMPYYAYNKWSAVFFIVYLIVELYLFMNLFLAVVYDAFQKNEKIKLKNLLLHKRQACQHAFKLLVSKNKPHTISLQQFQGLMKYFRPRKRRRSVYLSFKALDVTGRGELTSDEFFNVYTLTSLKWQKKQKEHYIWSASFHFPFNKIFKAIHRTVTGRIFEYTVYFIIVLNFLWIFGDTIFISIEKTSSAPNWIRNFHKYVWFSTVFVGLYVIEASLKILGLGPKIYFKSGWNVFDFLVTVVSALGVLFEFMSQSFYYFLVFRPLRLLRLFKLKKRYRDVLGTMFILSSRFFSICIVMIVVYYFFAIVGMEIFANHDMKNCCVNTSVEIYYKCDNQTNTFGYYYLNNFHNIVYSCVTLFEMTVVNNWYIIMDGYAAEFTDWSRIYFMLFYIITMVILTVVVSFVLEAFLFRIQYRTTMQGHDLEDDTIMKVDVEMSPNELNMCKNENIPLQVLYKTGTSDQCISTSSQNEGTVTYRGERLRSKDDFSVIMYKQEVQQWIEEEKNKLNTELEVITSSTSIQEMSESGTNYVC